MSGPGGLTPWPDGRHVRPDRAGVLDVAVFHNAPRPLEAPRSLFKSRDRPLLSVSDGACRLCAEAAGERDGVLDGYLVTRDHYALDE